MAALSLRCPVTPLQPRPLALCVKITHATETCVTSAPTFGWQALPLGSDCVHQSPLLYHYRRVKTI
ncbi:hypothetical protein E2C01_030899 [Portunus trituberculatus]|uniref:Uncharacterized protein n=1 Tax=Portunus trituberculatus TaxID=210409 RepID=A0A5B7ES91_PORTR|nr:hypothetical protein [Portunus trituberculatus]